MGIGLIVKVTRRLMLFRLTTFRFSRFHSLKGERERALYYRCRAIIETRLSLIDIIVDHRCHRREKREIEKLEINLSRSLCQWKPQQKSTV